MHLMWFADASLSAESRTGGIGMLARGCIFAVSQRQHLSAPDAHTAEVVSAGTNFSMLVPVAGVCQELRILGGVAVPFYLDSKTTPTVYVSTSDQHRTLPQRSLCGCCAAWLCWRMVCNMVT